MLREILRRIIKMINIADTRKLSKFFTYGEMTRSQTAVRYGIDNTPGFTELRSMVYLCRYVLDPIREYYGRPTNVSSGFRIIELNRRIGSEDNSQHPKGEAADFTVSGHNVTEVWKWIIEHSDLPFDQVIWEFGRWVHISYRRRSPARQICTIAKKVNNKSVYTHYTRSQIIAGDYVL